MRRYDPQPDRDQLQAAFDRALERAATGGGVRTDTGLDFPTQQALKAISAAVPNVPPQLIDAARAAFDGQLDGSNETDGLPSFLR
ncbi:hypothetical protein [Nocardia sp. SC052]|uniref:hypothetical protein n=1 Tax=Nocardia sichangensis TaxID=3385975 RepID=UPI0039A28F21